VPASKFTFLHIRPRTSEILAPVAMQVSMAKRVGFFQTHQHARRLVKGEYPALVFVVLLAEFCLASRTALSFLL
jgi:hypothetical protein